MSPPESFTDADACAEMVIERLSGQIALALPLGLGKAVHLTNALYRRARQNPDIKLSIHTALSLELPRPRSTLEARLLDPILANLYERVPTLDYLTDMRRGALPDNVRVEEFYLRPGAYLGVRAAQQNYLSVNYTSVPAALLDRGVNVVAQMVAPGIASTEVSLSCNPDLTLDLLDAARARGIRLLMVGEVNPQLPFMPHDAVLPKAEFDLLLDTGTNGYPLFPIPNTAVSLSNHAIALRIAGLIKDGGTLQIGIGSLGDAIAYAIGLRHTHNAQFNRLLDKLGPHELPPECDDLPTGLYGASEMFAEGFLHLHDVGVLRRTVEDNLYLHAGFFLGSAQFYDRLCKLSDDARRGINMTRISFTNSLLNDEQTKRKQRRHARFVNSAMMVTLTGAVVSDGLADGQVVSGVGGQYNFVAMAQELPGARSIIALPATRISEGKATSNIIWNYAHATIPRHLRDIVVTEYGVADLRNASDQEVIAALLNITDSRFQESLRNRAIAAGKLPKSHRIPEQHRNNQPAALQHAFTQSGELGMLPRYPLGTDLNSIEAELSVALHAIATAHSNPLALLRLALRGRQLVASPELREGLSRMGLLPARGLKARAYQALVAAALIDIRASARPLFPSQGP
ncbi:MAG: acetyl-CoA hydrolase/transferase C-terminal domain-containing protein [Pseudomonadales bacterium]